MERLYEKLDKTQEWVENNYYQLPIEQQNADLVTVNAFWNDFAQHRLEEPFVSKHWAEASNNFTEMMFALSLLDLPLEAGQHEAKFDGGNMTLTTGSAMVVFHQQIRPASRAAEAQSPILVSQNFFRHGDRYHQVQGERQDKFVTDEFLVQTLYGCQVVVTNPSASQQKVDVLVQIPRGAMPASGGKQTRSVHLDLQPYHTQTVEYYFYFPAAGEYQHFPVHVAKNEQLLAYVEPFHFHVVEQPSRIDRQSWDYVSQFASNDQVLDFLANNNIYELNLERIAFRVQDPKFFQDVTQLLAERHAYNQTLWSYGLKHDVPAAIREYLQHADGFVQQCGDYLSSELLVIDPVVRKTYQHMDYRPLVNARAHQLGRQRQILNDRFFAQYHRLMDVLSCRRRLDDDDLMSVTYYLLLQDRIEEALGYFSRVQPDNLETRLQYDYFAAYLDCFSESPQVARAIAGRYADYPVDRWRNAFASVTNLIEEIEGKELEILDPEDRTQAQTKLAATQPSFDFTVEAKQVRVDYQNLAAVQVNYYLIDLELLFSRNPFVQKFSGQFSHIRPNQAQQVELPAGRSTHVFDLPEALHHRNVLVEIVGAGETQAQAYYSNSLAVKVSDNYGQLQVTDDSTGRPLPGTYIKVYAELQDGRTQFYKDGYTDLRGRFDYTSLNTNELDYVKRFALLVLNEQKGGLVREALPPKR